MELDFLLRHRYALLFAAVLAEQVGLPVPAAPFLLAAGALAGMGKLDLAVALLVALLAAGLSDAFWFELGRARRDRVLRLLCRLSLEPDSCVRKTEEAFVRRGPNTLLVAKFVPGLNTVAPPLAGIIGMSRVRFHAPVQRRARSSGSEPGWPSDGSFRHQLDRVARRRLRDGRPARPRDRPGLRRLARLQVGPAPPLPQAGCGWPASRPAS